MGIGSIVSGAISIASSFLQGALAWFKAKNSPAMVANKVATDDQIVKAKVEGDIAKGDVGAVGKDIS